MDDLKPSNVRKKKRGRPSSFDRGKLVENIMNLFWERGYKGLSFNEIAHETGLTRASLYNAFDSKEALLLEALRYYFTQSPDLILSEIKDGDPVGVVFYQFFDNACYLRASDQLHRGCMAVNCLAEMMNENSDLGQTLKDIYEDIRISIVDLMHQAIKQGELPAHTDAEVTGNTVLAFMAGFNVFSKNGFSEPQLKEMCHSFLRNVGFKDTRFLN